MKEVYYGGDEFVLLLENLASPFNLRKVANRMLGLLKAPFFIDKHKINLTGSIGIAVYPNDGSIKDDLLNSADTAMYLAKSKGKNRVKYANSKLFTSH